MWIRGRDRNKYISSGLKLLQLDLIFSLRKPTDHFFSCFSSPQLLFLTKPATFPLEELQEKISPEQISEQVISPGGVPKFYPTSKIVGENENGCTNTFTYLSHSKKFMSIHCSINRSHAKPGRSQLLVTLCPLVHRAGMMDNPWMDGWMGGRMGG